MDGTLQETMARDNQHTLKGGRDELTSSFDNAASNVRGVFGGLEEQYAQPFVRSVVKPSVQRARKSWEMHPIVTAWAAVFVALALPPVLAFLGFCLLVLGSTLFLALIIALTVSGFTIFLVGSLLLITLGVLLFVSAGTTVFALSNYLVYRFLHLLHAHYTAHAAQSSDGVVTLAQGAVKAALADWADELRVFFLPRPQTRISLDTAGVVKREELLVDGFSVPLQGTKGHESSGSESSDPVMVERA